MIENGQYVGFLLTELRSHPYLFTLVCLVVVLCLFLTFTLPKILSFWIKHDNLTVKSVNEVLERIKHVESKLEYIEKHAVAGTSDNNDIKTELSIMIHEARDRDMRIAVLTMYNDKLPLWDRIDASLLYFSLGGNHNAEERVVSMIMAEKDIQSAIRLWFDMVSKFTRTLPDKPLKFIEVSLSSIERKVM